MASCLRGEFERHDLAIQVGLNYFLQENQWDKHFSEIEFH